MATSSLTKRVADRAKVPADVQSVANRLGRHFAAWRLSALLCGLGFSAELVAFLTGQELLVAAVVSLASLTTTAIAAKDARAKSPAKGRRTLLGGLSSTMWLTIASVGGVNPAMIAALMVGTLTLNAKRFHTIRIPYPQAALTAAPERKAIEAGGDIEPAERGQFEALWDKFVFPTGGALPGAVIGNPVPFEYGISHEGALARGKQDFGSVLMALPKIATGLDIPMERLVPDHDPQRPSRFTFKVVTRSPIAKPMLFDGPSYDDGKILLGPHSDGIGSAFWRLYVPDGIRGGAIYGGAGIGKSRLIETIALTAQACTPTVIVYIDGQDGGSSSALWENSTWSGGPDEAPDMLAAIERMQRHRQKYNRLHRLDGFTPSPELPGVLVVVDECHRIFEKNAKRWGYIARECRKVGIAVLAATQNPNADSMGNEEALRQSLQDGNTIVMRMQSRTASVVVPGIDVDLSKLPAMPGYGIPTAIGPLYGRPVAFRNRWLLTQSNIDKDPELVGNLTVHDWFKQTPKHELDKGSARAAGRIFTDRERIARERREVLEQEMRELEADTFDFEDEDAAEFAAPTAHQTGDVRSNVVAFPTLGVRPAADAEAPLKMAERFVLDSIAAGRCTPADWQTELSESGARKARTGLTDRGLIEKTHHGRYELTADGRRLAGGRVATG